MTVRFNSPRVAAFDANGNPRSGAKLYFYEPTTLTPKDVYSDSGLTTPILQPVTATSAGLWATIFMDASTYRVICKDSAGVTIYDEDNFDPGLGAGFGVSSLVGVAQGGTGASNAAAARANLGAASSSGLTSAQNDITELSALVDTVKNVGDPTRAGLLSKEDEVNRDLLEAGYGLICIQRVKVTSVTDATITTTTPAYDTSTPLISEGDEVFTNAFTPLSDSSTIRIVGYVTGDASSGTRVITLAMFSGSTCIGGDGFRCESDSVPYHGHIYGEEASASTSPRTYSIRAGVSSAATFTVNGSTGSLNGKRLSFMAIEEWVTV